MKPIMKLLLKKVFFNNQKSKQYTNEMMHDIFLGSMFGGFTVCCYMVIYPRIPPIST